MDTRTHRHQSTSVYTGRDPKVRPKRPHGRRPPPPPYFRRPMPLMCCPIRLRGQPTTRPIASPSPYSTGTRGATCSRGLRCHTRACSQGARARAPAGKATETKRNTYIYMWEGYSEQRRECTHLMQCGGLMLHPRGVSSEVQPRGRAGVGSWLCASTEHTRRSRCEVDRSTHGNTRFIGASPSRSRGERIEYSDSKRLA